MATDFISALAEVGASFAKTQSYQVQHLARTDPQYAWLAAAELSDAAHHHLMATCAKAGIGFLTTVFTADRVPFLHSLGLDTIKIGSGEGGDLTLIRTCRRAFARVLVSCGLAAPRQRQTRPGLGALTYLACESRYPATGHGVLRPLAARRVAGYSDHTVGIQTALAAIALGARYLEVHVNLPEAPRQQAWGKSMAQVRELVQWAAFCEQAVDGAGPTPKEIANIRRAFVGRWAHGS